MWRAFFLAIGTMLVILGIECLLIDSATMAASQEEIAPIQQSWLAMSQSVVETRKVIRPAEWTPWSFIATGAVVLLYAYTLPKRWGSAG